MALKATIATKAERDALAEPVRALYMERDGKWVLDVEGMSPTSEVTELKTKIAEFRDNNKLLFEENKELKPLKEKLKGVTDIDGFIAEHATLKAKVEEFKKKGVGDTNDLDSAIANALKPITEKLAASENARIESEKRADAAKFRELVTSEATKSGVKPQSVRHVLREAEEKFELKDGALKPKSGVRHPSDPLKELTPADWLLDLSKSDDYLFGETSGGGAAGIKGNTNGRPDAKELINPSPEEMGVHMDDIIAGKVVVRRQ
jgi:hypothetical protein